MVCIVRKLGEELDHSMNGTERNLIPPLLLLVTCTVDSQ